MHAYMRVIQTHNVTKAYKPLFYNITLLPLCCHTLQINRNVNEDQMQQRSLINTDIQKQKKNHKAPWQSRLI